MSDICNDHGIEDCQCYNHTEIQLLTEENARLREAATETRKFLNLMDDTFEVRTRADDSIAQAGMVLQNKLAALLEVSDDN